MDDLKYWVDGLGLGWKSTFKKETGLDPEWMIKKFNDSVSKMTTEEFEEWSNQFKIK